MILHRLDVTIELELVGYEIVADVGEDLEVVLAVFADF